MFAKQNSDREKTYGRWGKKAKVEGELKLKNGENGEEEKNIEDQRKKRIRTGFLAPQSRRSHSGPFEWSRCRIKVEQPNR